MNRRVTLSPWVLPALVGSLFACRAVVAGDIVDPVEQTLAAAKEEAWAAIEAARRTLASDLGKRAEAARAADDPKAADAAAAEAKAFADRGDLPKSVPTAAYELAVGQARARLEAAYAAAVARYAKDGNAVAARGTQKELDEFKLAASARKPDPFRVGARWVVRGPAGKLLSELKVLGRDGDVADVRSQGPGNTIVARGRVDGTVVRWGLADVTKVEHGQAFAGVVRLSDGDVRCTLEFTYKGGKSGTKVLGLDDVK
jgi:hypothetical protein